VLKEWDKKSLTRACFTFCLPGRPKVNAAAHVALGYRARRPRISAATTVAPSGKLKSVIGFASSARLLAERHF
jgi:hypothetical protein